MNTIGFHSCVEFKKQNKQRGKREREKPGNRLLATENNGYQRGGRWGQGWGWEGEAGDGD